MANRPTKETFSLKCMLTEEEKLKYGVEMSEAVSEKSRKEDDLKSVSTQFKAEIAGLNAKVGAIAEKIRSGSEYRNVECTIVYDWDRKVRTWIRKDTGEIYRDDIIPEHMLQEEMKLNHEKDKELVEAAA
jgi:hypothetical protein